MNSLAARMHRFWDIGDPMQRQMEMIHFHKNMTIVGAALMLLRFFKDSNKNGAVKSSR